MLREKYRDDDFDFAVVYIPASTVFYIMPVGAFIDYGSSITFVESEKRQRKPRSAPYRDAWQHIVEFANRNLQSKG